MVKRNTFFSKLDFRVFWIVLLGMGQMACVTTQAPPTLVTAQTPPDWVIDVNKAYPMNQWMAFAESDKTQKAAENKALAALATAFKTDVATLTKSSQAYTQAVSETNGKQNIALTNNQSISQDVAASSNVAGLIGVEMEHFTDKDGAVYAIARMNRKECAARYNAMIRENERVIELLKTEADRVPATFDAYEALSFAANLAEVTDNFQGLLEVLDSSATARRPKYGSAAAVKVLAQNTAKSIVITVQVEGDEGDRIAKAFKSYFDQQGFRTNSSGTASYVLVAELALEDVDLGPNQPNKFVRYVLAASVEEKNGTEVFTYSGTGREGHVSQTEARQRAIRKAEELISQTDFARQFNAYLSSLLQ
jgi:hypothetical protein